MLTMDVRVELDTTLLKQALQHVQDKAAKLKDLLNNMTIQVLVFQPLESFDLGGWLMKLKIFFYNTISCVLVKGNKLAVLFSLVLVI